MVNRKNKILPSFIPEKVIIHSKQTLGRPSDIMVNVGDMVKEGEVLAKPKDLISSYVHSSIPGRIEDIMDSGKDYKKIKIKYEGTLESLNKQPETINSLSDEDILSRIEKAGIIESYDNNIPIFYLISLSRLNNIKSVYIDATTKEDRPFLNDYLLSTKKKEIQLVIEILKKVFK